MIFLLRWKPYIPHLIGGFFLLVVVVAFVPEIIRALSGDDDPAGRSGVIQLESGLAGVGMWSSVEKQSRGRCILRPDVLLRNPDGSMMNLTGGERILTLEEGKCSNLATDVWKIKLIESGLQGWTWSSAVSLDGP